MALWSKVGATVRRAAPTLCRDVAGLAGVGSIAYGAWLVYEPAGFISAGVLLLAGVLQLARQAD